MEIVDIFARQGRRVYKKPASMPSADELHVSAADHLKLNFPMAWSAATLAWGFIEFQDVRLFAHLLASGVDK